MATFTNQTTNLSTLSTLLTDLSRELKGPFHEGGDPGNNNAETGTNQKLEDAQQYLLSLTKRVEKVDESMMKATEYLLPTSNGGGKGGGASRMTATELSQLLSSLHVMNAQKIERIEKLLAGSPHHSQFTSPTGENVEQDGTQSSHGGTPYHWSLGLPLEQVVETDNETDRDRNSHNGSVSSMMMRSPSVTHTPARQGPGTPLTPSIRELRLSASTASILTHDLIETKSPGAVNRLDNSNMSLSRVYSDEEDDDDDGVQSLRTSVSNSIATLRINIDKAIDSSRDYDTKDWNPSVNVSSNNHLTGTTDDKHHRNESNSQLVFSDSDDDGSVEESTLCPTVIAEDRKFQSLQRDPIELPSLQHDPIEHRRRSTNTIEDLETIAESTICSGREEKADRYEQTNPASGKKYASVMERYQSRGADVLSPPYRAGQLKNKTRLDISHVEVNAETSPSQTFLTMDGTMFLHDLDALSQSSKFMNDAASLGDQTPVLDRYRIISDDNSIGFKVLPNERGSHRKLKASVSKNNSGTINDTVESISLLQNIPKSVRFHGHVESGATNPTQYRKTPYRSVPDDPDGPDSTNHQDSILQDVKSRSSSRKIRFALSPDGDKEQKFIRNVCTPHPKDSQSGQVEEVMTKASSAVQFDLESPSEGAPQKNFRKTPYKKDTDFDGESQSGHFESREAPTLRFDNSVRFQPDNNTLTPSNKRQVPNYRKTPHSKVNGTALPVQTVNFDHPTPPERTPPVGGQRNVYRKTPVPSGSQFGSSFISESEVVESPNVQFDLPPSNNLPRGNEGTRSTYRKTPYAKSVDPTMNDENPTDSVSTRMKRERGIRFQSNPNNARSPLRDISPKLVCSTPQNIHLMNQEALSSPASTLTGFTALTSMDNQRELFPSESTEQKYPLPERKSSSSLIAKVSDREFASGNPTMKMQYSFDDLNQAISALNGATFLRNSSNCDSKLFREKEAKEIIKKVGFTSRKAKGLLNALCHWKRLEMHQVLANDDDETYQKYFEVVLSQH